MRLQDWGTPNACGPKPFALTLYDFICHFLDGQVELHELIFSAHCLFGADRCDAWDSSKRLSLRSGTPGAALRGRKGVGDAAAGAAAAVAAAAPAATERWESLGARELRACLGAGSSKSSADRLFPRPQLQSKPKLCKKNIYNLPTNFMIR